MDMGVREWLVVVAVILIAGILVDGYRRVRAAKRLKRDFDFSLDKSPEGYGDELPNGGARVISAIEQNTMSSADKAESVDPLFMPPVRESAASDELHQPPIEPARHQAYPESDDAGFGNSVTNRDNFEPEESFGSALEEPLIEPSEYSTEHTLSADEFTRSPAAASQEVPRDDVDPKLNLASNFAPDTAAIPTAHHEFVEKPQVRAQTSLNLDEPVPVLMEVDGQAPLNTGRTGSPTTRRQKASPSAQQPTQPQNRSRATESSVEETQDRRPSAQEVIVINVFARDPKGFDGNLLLQELLANGLKFGNMSIFHRHEQFNGNGEILFSIANGVEPGNFDLDKMAEIRTPLITLFLGLPGSKEPLKAFEMMASAAHNFSQHLGGDLKDESRSAMTQQTLEHCKQRIMDFERLRMTRDRQ